MGLYTTRLTYAKQRVEQTTEHGLADYIIFMDPLLHI